MAHPWHLHLSHAEQSQLHFYFRAGIGKLPVKGQIVNSIGFAGQRIYVTDIELWQCREHAGTQPLDDM